MLGVVGEEKEVALGSEGKVEKGFRDGVEKVEFSLERWSWVGFSVVEWRGEKRYYRIGKRIGVEVW